MPAAGAYVDPPWQDWSDPAPIPGVGYQLASYMPNEFMRTPRSGWFHDMAPQPAEAP